MVNEYIIYTSFNAIEFEKKGNKIVGIFIFKAIIVTFLLNLSKSPDFLKKVILDKQIRVMAGVDRCFCHSLV